MFSEVFRPVISGIDSIKARTPAQARKILIDNKTEIIRILREDQLNDGLNSSGTVVGTYSAVTAALADLSRPRKPKVAGQPYNFEWTGDFVDGLYLFFEDVFSYSIFSTDEKAAFLVDKFGDIVTLTDENNDRVNFEILIPGLTIWFFDELKKMW